MPVLNVNIDHVATVRQVRHADEPDPVWAAVECELGGASGITIHLREDRRHIQDRDAELLRQSVCVKLNLEMAATEAMTRTALQLRPDQVTLVPEKRQELTTEGGLDCCRNQKRLSGLVSRLRRKGIEVSAFVEPSEKQIAGAAAVGCEAIELHTGAYANAKTEVARKRELKKLALGCEYGWKHALLVHAGHGLTYRNIGPVAGIFGIEDFNIGHSIIARSLMVGMREATREMIRLIDRAVAE